MKLIKIVFILIMGFPVLSNSQTYVDIPWREGIILKKEKEEKGMIRLGGDLGAPWLNNAKVYFVSQDKWIEGKRPKKKVITEYKPKEIAGYKTFTENEEGKRVEMNFTTFEIMIMGALKKKRGKAFLKHEESGAVDIYSYVPKPSKKIMSTAEERYKDNQKALAKSTIYLKKGEGDLVSATKCELVELLKDCPEVVDKINNEEYGFKPKSKRPKKKGLGKLMASGMGDNGLENRIYLAVKDYNACINQN